MNSAKPLFRTASQGIVWLLSTSVLALVASLIAQLLLGWWLTETEYGVYALAFASSDFLMVFRDGGVKLWLSRLTPERFERVQGHAFWLAAAFSVATSLILAALSFIVGSSWVYDDPRITRYLLILAVAFPFTTYSSVALAKMHVELQFRGMALIRLVSVLARHSTIVTLAWFGWGPLSFALGYFFIVFLELFIYYGFTRVRPWLTRPSWKRGALIFRKSRWSLGGALATAILRTADYAVLGLVAPKAVVGFYFFGYQLAMQPVLLFSESLRRVVIPTFSRRFKGEDQQARNLSYIGVFLGAVAATGLLGLGITAGPFEQLLWHGKWTESVRPIQFLALAMPLHLAAYVAEMFSQSQGQFRSWTIAVFVRGIGFGAAVLVAKMLGGAGDPGFVAAVVGIYIAVSGLAEIAWLMRKLDASTVPLFRAMVPPYVCGLIVSVPFLFTDWPGNESPLVNFIARGTTFVIGLALMWALFSRGTYHQLWEMVSRGFLRSKESPNQAVEPSS